MSVSGYVLTRTLAIEADTSHVGGSRVLVVSPLDYTPLRPCIPAAVSPPSAASFYIMRGCTDQGTATPWTQAREARSMAALREI